MKPNPVGWFEIYVQDMDRARAFYESVFQTKLEHLPSPDVDLWAFPMAEAKGAAGALVKMQEAGSGGLGTIVYFTCDNCGVEAKRAAEAGGSIHKERTSIGDYGFIALVRDTENNMIGLHSLR